MPRPLFYFVLVMLIGLWAKRFLRWPAAPTTQRNSSAQKSGTSGKPMAAKASMPNMLVCGACGSDYDPHRSGWICPKCGK